jgi:carbohydrate-binding DOMON domain-containing protein
MSTQYRLVQSGKTTSGGCSAGQGSSEPVASRIYHSVLYRTVQLKKALKLRKMSRTKLFDSDCTMEDSIEF